jgi:hypothetical protein
VLIANQIYLILLAIVWENGLNVTLSNDMAPVFFFLKKKNQQLNWGRGCISKAKYLDKLTN